MSPTLFEIIPHPQHRGQWLLKPNECLPYGLWYRELRHAINYAEWSARDLENAEIRVYERGGILQETRVLKGSAPAGLGACS